MINGKVQSDEHGGLEPWIALPVEDDNGEFQECDVILDTGFTGYLTLPETVIEAVGLVSEGQRAVTVASGREETLEYYTAWVSWHDRLKKVGVFQSIDQPLLGMELLYGSRITVDAWEDGEVVIEEVSPARHTT